MTHQRRTGLSAGVEVNFKEDMVLTIKKEMFLANKSNKLRFIYMLGSKLEKEGCEVVYSEGDADFDIVNKAISVSTDMAAVVVGEDTDLLILLLHNAKQDRISIYFSPQQKQNAKKEFGISSFVSEFSVRRHASSFYFFTHFWGAIRHQVFLV